MALQSTESCSSPNKLCNSLCTPDEASRHLTGSAADSRGCHISPADVQVGPEVLGYGSQGTMVFEGRLHGRAVAVKRMLRHLYHLAKKEIDALILSDEVSHSVPSLLLLSSSSSIRCSAVLPPCNLMK